MAEDRTLNPASPGERDPGTAGPAAAAPTAADDIDVTTMSGREVLEHLRERLRAGGHPLLLQAIDRVSAEYARLEEEAELLFEALEEAERKIQAALSNNP
jgi:hypothetical protein